jgi:pimeloyl-ACP methyl ester carboxylesterase
VAKSRDYDHLLLYAHGGLNSTSDSAKRIRAMKGVFKDNRVYPYHFMYDTGIMEEMKDLVLGRYGSGGDKVAGFTDYTDHLIESSSRTVGRALWREMKRGAKRPFRDNAGGTQTLAAFFEAMDKSGKPKKIHVVGHSTGGILLAYLVDAVASRYPGTRIETCSLLAPAATLDLFASQFLPRLGKVVRRMQVFNLSERLELDDNVALVYRKSLLYLVSRAFEERREAPLLGMRIYSKEIDPPAGADLDFIYSRKRRGKKSRSTSHGGFDNDRYTMNSVLRAILGATAPKREFTTDDLAY